MSKSFSVLDVLGGDSVESSPALIGNDSGVDLQAVSLLVLLDQFLLLQLLQTPSDGLGASGSVALGGTVSALQPTVDVGKQTDAGVGPQIDLAGEGSNFNVDPVVAEGGELVACIRYDGTWSGLDVVGPGGSFDQVVLLEVLRECLDELLCGEVLHGEEGLLLFAKHNVVKNIQIYILNIPAYQFIAGQQQRTRLNSGNADGYGRVVSMVEGGLLWVVRHKLYWWRYSCIGD